MGRDKKHDPDPNENAARIDAESMAEDSGAAGNVEDAWAEWSSHIQNTDKRAMSLLKAAFEAGYDAAMKAAATNLGRSGGLKGGKARAEKLTAKQRSEIAKKAAAARWGDEDN